MAQNMDDETHEYWERYIGILADNLKLRDWVVTLSREAPDSMDEVACIGTRFGQKHAELSLNLRAFLSSSPFERKATLVHELLHLHNCQRKELTRKFLDNCVEEDKGGFFWDVYYEAFEEETENFAQIIAPLMPDPEIVVGKEPLNTAGY